MKDNFNSLSRSEKKNQIMDLQKELISELQAEQEAEQKSQEERASKHTRESPLRRAEFRKK